MVPIEPFVSFTAYEPMIISNVQLDTDVIS